MDKNVKCSRCCLDLTKASDKGGCICSTFHPIAGNKSGNNVFKVIFEYDGYDYKDRRS